VELNPYIGEKAFVELSDGRINVKSRTNYSRSSKRADLRVTGSLKVSEFFVNDSRSKKAILSFKEAGMKSFTLEVFPNRLHVDEANVDGFYVDAVIDENKTLNFAKLIKSDSSANEEAKKVEPMERGESFPVKIVKLGVTMGSARFSDFSIPLKFRTDIHDLNGYVYALSTVAGETSYVDVKGEIDEYGVIQLKGSLNSSNPKEFLDLDLSFGNLALNSFSGYSASFAGYEIEDGKLYLDLGYDILNSEIKGSNSVIIKKMKLGSEIEDENSSSIPLGFIIGLLEDGDGIIDIDMPVEGNVDEPDFKYGALVFKTFGNLLLKAVASPFSFLGSMMGMDGDALEHGEFEAAKDDVSPPLREKLDKIAKMMIKRPKISLGITGKYDDSVDKKAMRLEKLISLVVKKSGIKNRDEHKSAMTIDMLEEICEEISGDEKFKEIKKKLAPSPKSDGLQRAYHSALAEKAIAMQSVSLEELKALGASRAKKMKEYLTLEKNVDGSRIDLKEVASLTERAAKTVKVKLEIEVK